MQIAYVCNRCSDEIRRILTEFSDDHKLFCFESVEALAGALDAGKRFKVLVVEENDIHLSLMNRIEDVIHRMPSARLILICFSARLKSNLSLYPVTFLSPQRAVGMLPALMRESAGSSEGESEDLLMIRWNKVMYTVPKRDVLYMERNARNTFIVTRKGQLRCTAVVDDLETQMPDYFARCHKSYLVNMYEIEKVSRSEILMKNGAVIPVSRTRYLPFLEKYKEFLEKHNLQRDVPRQYERRRSDPEIQ